MSDISIKFRGVDVFSHELVYGDYLSPMDSTKLSTFGLPQIMNKEGIHFVTSNSVTQLAGYDDNGEELYCGDVVVNNDGIEFVVEKWFMVVNDLDRENLTGGCFKLHKQVIY